LEVFLVNQMRSLEKHWEVACKNNSYNRRQIEQFMALFLKWNRSINLSAARTNDALAEHVADCFYLIGHAPTEGRCLDVGAGGGLPGALLAIALPHLEVMSLEPVHKKQSFLRTVARELGLTNYDALPIRLEDFSEGEFDAVVSRATWDLTEWMRMGRERARIGGVVLGMEALAEVDLDAETERFRYDFHGKARAVLKLTRRS
jgi:16S rRNA (guanine527-N7)-methyltransferase